MRIILLLLSLAVCFLAGVLYGVEKDTVYVADSPVNQVSEQGEEPNIVTVPAETVDDAPVLQSDDTPAYKAASALASIVDFIYDIIVEILYQVSKLFY